MKILVIGKNGQVGSALVKRSTDKQKIFGVSHEQLELTDTKNLIKTIDDIRPDCIINTASYLVVGDCETHPDRAFAINAIASKNLAEICHTKGIFLVTYSTDKVFDGKKKTAYIETDCPNPLQTYGISMLAREQFTQNYCPNSLIIRTCGIFGGAKGSRAKGGNFVLYILSEAKKKEILEVAEDQIGCVVSAEDLADVTLQLIQKKETGIYNIVNTGYAPWSDIAAYIVQNAHLSLTIKPVTRGNTFTNFQIPNFAALSTDKLHDKGILMDTWQKAIKRYITFLQQTDRV